MGKKKLAKKFITFLLSGLIFVHFFIIAIDQSPDNPIKHQFKFQAASYISPFFNQRWTLFAPNPINSNLNLLFQFRKPAQNAAGWDSTGWVDVSKPLVEERHGKFWSNAPRLLKFVSASIQDVQKARGKIFEHIEKTDSLKADSVKVLKVYDALMSATVGHRSLIQYGEHVLQKYNRFHDNEYPPEETQIAYRFVDLRFPRFSKRHLSITDEEHTEVQVFTSDWYPKSTGGLND